MTTRRPRNPKTDTNHGVVPAVVRDLCFRYAGLPLRLIDTSKAGGNLVDWILYIGPLAVMLEVKQPGEAKRLTDGEAETQSWGVPFAVVEDEQDVADVLARYARIVCLMPITSVEVVR